MADMSRVVGRDAARVDRRAVSLCGRCHTAARRVPDHWLGTPSREVGNARSGPGVHAGQVIARLGCYHPDLTEPGTTRACMTRSPGLLPPRLLEGIGQGDQAGLAPRRTDERDAHRQPADRSRRNGDRRVPGDRGRRRRSDGVVVAEHVVGEPGWIAGQREHGVQPVLGQRRVQAGRGQRFRVLPGRLPAFIGPAACRFRLLEDLLAEMPEHLVRVSGVVLDQLGERARVIAVERGQIGVQVVFELMPQGEELGFGDLVSAGQLDLVNNLRAVRAEHAHRVFEQRRCRGGRLRRAIPPDADPGRV